MTFASVTYQQAAVAVAIDAGLFAKHGLEVSTVMGSNSIPALLSREVQIASTSGEAAILANLGGASLEIVASGAPYLLQDFIVRPEIGSMADLKGKPVGFTGRGTITETVVRMAASRAGLDPDRDLVLVDLGTTDKAAAGLLAGAVFGTALTAPTSDAVLRQGARVLYQFSEEQVPYPSANTVVSKDWAANNEGTLLSYLGAMAEAVNMYRTDPARVVEIYMKWAKLDDAAAKRGVELGAKNMPVKMLPTREGVKVLQDLVAQQNPAASGLDTSALFDDRYIKTLQSQGLYTRLAP